MTVQTLRSRGTSSRMHVLVLALGVLAGACGSNTSSQEKLDAGQRKYCDAYCADASKDARTIDAGGGSVDGTSEKDVAQPDVTVYADALAADAPIVADTAVLRLDARPGVDLAMDVGSGSGGAAGQGNGGAGGQGSGGAGGFGGAGGSTGLRSDAVEPDLRDAPADTTDAPADTADAPTDTADAPGDAPSDASDAPADASADGDAPIGSDASDAPAPPDLRLDTGSSPTCSIGASKWARGWAGVGGSLPAKLALAADGTPWAVGSYFASLDFGGTVLAHTADTKADAFLAKLDPATGQATHAFAFNDVNGNGQNAYGVAVASNGNVVVTGYFNGEIDFDDKNSDGSGPSGNPGTAGLDFLQNASSIPYYALIDGTSSGTVATPIKAHMVDVGTGALLGVGSNPTQSAFAICGKTSKVVPNWSNSGATKGVIFPTNTAVAGGGLDIVVAKIDAATGAVIWGKQFGGASDQICESVAIDNNGDVIIAGAYTGTLNFSTTVTLPVVSDSTLGLLYVAKLSSANGTPLAAATWGSAGRSDAFALTTDASNNIVFGGSLGGNVDFGGGVSITNAGLTDAFVLKLTSTLAPVWAKAFGDAAYDQNVQSLAVGSTGDVFIGGNFKGALTGLGLTAVSNSNLAAFTAQLSSSDGSPRASSSAGLCAFSYGVATGAQSVNSLVVAQTATGAAGDAVLMVGGFSSTITLGTTTLYAEDKLVACTSDSSCAKDEPCGPGGFCASSAQHDSFFTSF